jgi:hypothetical protein
VFKNILTPTDGSDLAAKAVEQGVLFRQGVRCQDYRSNGAQPVHMLSVKPSQLESTPIEYKKHAESYGIVAAAPREQTSRLGHSGTVVSGRQA